MAHELPPPPAANRGARPRSPARRPLEARDLELLKCFTAFRLATASDLYPFVAHHFPRPYLLWRRLHALAGPAYRCLAEPPAQTLRLYAKRGRPAHIYALGTQGARALRAHGVPLPRSDYDQKAKALKPYSLEHPLSTTRALAPFLLALRRHARFALRTLLPDGSFHDRVTILQGGRELELPIHPDATLLLEDREEHEQLALFLEVDCGTEPPQRTGLAQTSFYKKVLAYFAYSEDPVRLSRELEGTTTFVVLTIAQTARRRAALLAAAATADPAKRGGDLFWFATGADVVNADPDPLFASIWTTAAGEVGSLFTQS